MKRIEILNNSYRIEDYGGGGPPDRLTVIVSDISEPGITAGRPYPVIRHEAHVYVVLNDNKHERVFSMHSQRVAECRNPWYSPPRPAYWARVYQCVDDTQESQES